MRLLLLYDRLRKAIKRKYINRVFCSQIKVPKGEMPLIGEITLINRNIKLGKNVHIYPGVFFWGDGPIEIGNNVDIGKDTILYASSGGVLL